MEAKLTAARAVVDELAARPENQSPDSLWYCIATTALTAANLGPAVPHVYTVATHSLAPAPARLVLRRIKEALLKTTMLHGVPRTLNAFYPLAATVRARGEEYVDRENVRAGSEVLRDPEKLRERALKYFRNVYREDAGPALEPYEMAAELEHLCLHLEYGLYLSETSILGPVETSQVTLGALLPLDVPTQVAWHMRGLVRNGGDEAQVVYALDIARRVCDAAGVKLEGGVPGMEVLGRERLY